MRSIRPLFLLALAIPVWASAQLNGSYTVGPAGNYTTIAAAITALQTQGVSGHVTMNIISGTYSGNWIINSIPGTSTTSRVTFKSQTGITTSVILTNAAAAPVFTLNGCAWVRIQELTINSANGCMLLQGSTSQVVVTQCALSAGPMYGAVNTSPTFTGTNVLVWLNTITSGLFAVRLVNIPPSYGTSMNVTLNTISGVTNSGISIERADDVAIGANTITSAGGNTSTYNDAISVRNCLNDLEIRENLINWGIGTHGIYVDQHTPQPGSPPFITENMITVTGGNAVGGAISVLNVDEALIRHNSMRCTVPREVLKVQFSDNVVLEGNIMQTTTEECMMTQTATFTTIDRNIYYNTQPNAIRWNVSTYYGFTAWQGQGWDANSLFADPLFVSTSDLHIQSNSPAISLGPLPVLTSDIDVDARPWPMSSLPDIGADERPEGCTGMSGTYTIGPGVGNNFMSFSHAVLAMSNCSLVGPVTFLVQSGSYTEQVSIPLIAGTSATNTITFRSQALDSAAVVLNWPSSGIAGNDWVLRMNGGDRVIFDRITVERTGTSSYGNAVVFNSTAGSAGSQFTRFEHCRIISGTTSGISGYLISSSPNGDEDSVTVKNTRFVSGRVGIGWITTTDNDLLLVEDNVFQGQSMTGASMGVRDRAFTLRRNSITVTAITAVGLSISNSTAGFEVSRNSISSAYYAMSLATGISAALGEPRVYNNMLRGNNVAMLVWGASNTGLRIDNNSMYGTTNALLMNTGTITIASFRNNALMSPGIVLNRAVATANISVASHNAICRTTAGPIAFWTANQNTMATLQAASGQFASSFVADPRYYDAANNDLHAYAMELDAAGTPISYVTIDHDGDTRNATTPDIGADEFIPALWTTPVNTCGTADVITCNGSGIDQWIYKDRKVVVRINDNGQNLGSVAVSVYVHSGAVRQSDMGQYYLNRNWHVDTQFPFASPITVRVFCTGPEFAAYAGADPLVTTPATAALVHYNGVLENCAETDNPAGQQWTPLATTNGNEPRIQIPSVPGWFSGTIAADGELYLTALGQVLPVELLSFTARNDAANVLCEWATATEHNNDYFTIERSADGVVFEEIGEVGSAGTSLSELHYTFPDRAPLNGLSYYRLRQTDFDGTESRSNILAVWREQSADELSVFPNPCADLLFIAGDVQANEIAHVIDATGRVVMTFGGAASAQLHVEQLFPGSYWLQLTGERGVRSARFVKQ